MFQNRGFLIWQCQSAALPVKKQHYLHCKIKTSFFLNISPGVSTTQIFCDTLR